LIIQRYKYDKKKRVDYYGDKPTPYDNLDETIGNTTDDWWLKFNALNTAQKEQAERIISENRFSDVDIDVSDEDVKSVLKFYQIKRDEA
ncbi:MAG TPA: hypothetical protein DEQ30_12145, partial [Porphyromonadaceae bacterium]|nr:hypothetical protein [Porphyromonadaceae bacterium]